MSRSFFYYNNETGERAEGRDVSGLSDGEIFSIEYQMLNRCEGPWILIDSADADAMASLKSA